MPQYPSDIAFTDSVKAIQSSKGSRESYAVVEEGQGWETEVTPQLAAFLAELDMFYMSTANAVGQPYIQYRGGAPGFLKVVDKKSLGFADFGGNRQYVTLGNLADNSKACIFLMDYVNRRRIKLWGNARVIEDDSELIEQLRDSSYPKYPERAILFDLEAWDVNCSQHIHRRIPHKLVAPKLQQLQERIEELESEIAKLKSGTD